MQPSKLFLIGLPGSGKTTLGEAVAARTGCVFVDLDREIERRVGQTVSEIFASQGEEAFRRIERETLATVATTATERPLLIACGGGTPCSPGNMELMNAAGLTVRLRASHQTLLRRLLLEQSKRPLVAALDPKGISAYITRTARCRNPFYRLAGATFRSDLLETEQQVDRTARRFIRQFLSRWTD